MSLKALKEFERIKAEVKSGENQIYSDYLGYLTQIVLDLYKEFQEVLGPGKAIEVFSYTDGVTMGRLKFTKDGVEIKKDQVVSAEEYVKQQLKKEETSKGKYIILVNLLGQIENSDIRLKGIYLPEDMGTFKIYRPGLTKRQIEESIKALENHIRLHPLAGEQNHAQKTLEELKKELGNET